MVSDDDEEEACNAYDRVLYSLDAPVYYNPATNAVMKVPYHIHRFTGIVGCDTICPGMYIMPMNVHHGPLDVYGVPSFIHKSMHTVPFEGAVEVSYDIWQDSDRLPAGSSVWLYQDKDFDKTPSVTIGEGSGSAAEITAVGKRAGKRSTDEKAVSMFRSEESGAAAFASAHLHSGYYLYIVGPVVQSDLHYTTARQGKWSSIDDEIETVALTPHPKRPRK